MMWLKLPFNNGDEKQLYGRIDDDGLIRITCIEEYAELQDWIAEGNTPEPYIEKDKK